MRLFLNAFSSLFLISSLTACDVSFSASPGGIKDLRKPAVNAELAPLPEGFLDFSRQSTKSFFHGGRDAVTDRLHPAMLEISDMKWAALEKLASDDADFTAIEYYGHAFGETEGIPFVVIQLKIPFEGGYNLVKTTMPTNEDCCRLAGLEVNLEKMKSFKLGK